MPILSFAQLTEGWISSFLPIIGGAKSFFDRPCTVFPETAGGSPAVFLCLFKRSILILMLSIFRQVKIDFLLFFYHAILMRNKRKGEQLHLPFYACIVNHWYWKGKEEENADKLLYCWGQGGFSTIRE